MTEHPCADAAADSRSAGVLQLFCRGLSAAVVMTAFASAALNCAAAAPAAGETTVYSLVNGYNNETRGHVSYCVERSDDGRVVVAATTKRDGAQWTAMEIYTTDGNWLHHTLTNHDQLFTYDFSPPFAVYDFPLAAGKQWSTRVNAVEYVTGARRSIRVDGTVQGSERIRVPAGEFDTFKIIRSIYAGDADIPRTETIIMETEWYAPALGRAVRLVTRSRWLNLAIRFPTTNGDWNIYELMSMPALAQRGCQQESAIQDSDTFR